MNYPKIRFVVATRENRENFLTGTATGKSLSLYQFPFVELDLYESNREGLSTVYNRSIEKSKSDPAILVFVHDDIHITDFYWADQLVSALSHFGVVGVAGNRQRSPHQDAWTHMKPNGEWVTPEYLSGVVGHGYGFPNQELTVYGRPCQEVKLLDGVFLACHSNTLHQHHLRFDEQFDFHFYDLDFCRHAEIKGIKMGTWSISIIHESRGGFYSEGWLKARDRYFAKWKS